MFPLWSREEQSAKSHWSRKVQDQGYISKNLDKSEGDEQDGPRIKMWLFSNKPNGCIIILINQTIKEQNSPNLYSI